MFHEIITSSFWSYERPLLFGVDKCSLRHAQFLCPTSVFAGERDMAPMQTGLAYMHTLTPQTTPIDRHIWQSHGASGVSVCALKYKCLRSYVFDVFVSEL